jgi:hypothetical protein
MNGGADRSAPGMASMAGEAVRSGQLPGGYFLTAALVLSVLISAFVDYGESHLFNPDWPPHARFHDVAMLNLLAGVALVALWLLWRKSREPDVAAITAGLVTLVFWSVFFWATFAFEGASLQALPNEPPPQVAGIKVYPNVVSAAVFSLVAATGLWLRFRKWGPINIKG